MRSSPLPARSISISAIFPAYNDGGTIASKVLTAISALRQVTQDYEIIVVNDGSGYETAEVLAALAGDTPSLRVIHHDRNMGYGATLRTGFSAAQKDWIFYTDGDGRQIRDLIFIDDTVDALLTAMENPAADGEVYNLGGQEPICLADLARLVIAINGGGDFRLEPLPEERRRIDIGDYYADTTKIRTELGWAPRTSLREGLEQTLSFFRQQRAHYW